MTKEETHALLKKICKNTLMETLDIEVSEVGDDYLIAKMPVTPKVHQPDGVLHGGATVALAETVGSMASFVFLNTDDYYVRGIEISANHIKSISEGFVYAKATYLHKGRTTQLWNIRITDEADNLDLHSKTHHHYPSQKERQCLKLNIFTRLQEHLSSELPFVAYRKPILTGNRGEVSAFLQEDDKLNIHQRFYGKRLCFCPF